MLSNEIVMKYDEQYLPDETWVQEYTGDGKAAEHSQSQSMIKEIINKSDDEAGSIGTQEQDDEDGDDDSKVEHNDEDRQDMIDGGNESDNQDAEP